MAEQEKYKKTPVTTYNFGKGNYIMVAEMSKDYHCWGKIAGENISLDVNNKEDITKELSKVLEDRRKKDINKSIIEEEYSLRFAEKNLEGVIQDLGGRVILRE